MAKRSETLISNPADSRIGSRLNREEESIGRMVPSWPKEQAKLRSEQGNFRHDMAKIGQLFSIHVKFACVKLNTVGRPLPGIIFVSAAPSPFGLRRH